MPSSISRNTGAPQIASTTLQQLKEPGAVDKLIQAAEADGTLGKDERLGLLNAAKVYRDGGFAPAQARQLEAYLGLSNASLRHAFADAAKDGVVDIADAGRIALAMQKDGKVSGNEKMTVRGAMLAFKVDGPARQALEAAAGLSHPAPVSVTGLDAAPKGTTAITLWNSSLIGRSTLNFRKNEDGTMQVQLLPASIRDYGWINVEKDGTVLLHGSHSGGYQESETWEVKGNVSFANGAFTANITTKELWNRTRPQGSNDTPNWNSGNRIPYTDQYGDTFKTANDPSLAGTTLYPGVLQRTPYSDTPVTALKTPTGVELRLGGGAPYNVTLKVEADGSIKGSQWTGQVTPDGHVSLRSSVRLSADYTETVSYAGNIPGLKLP